MRLAYLKEAGFGDLEKYIAANRQRIRTEEFIGSRGMNKRIFQFLAAGRADAVLMTSDVYDMGVRDSKEPLQFREAGCLPNQKLAVGLSTANPQRAPDRR